MIQKDHCAPAVAAILAKEKKISLMALQVCHIWIQYTFVYCEMANFGLGIVVRYSEHMGLLLASLTLPII